MAVSLDKLGDAETLKRNIQETLEDMKTSAPVDQERPVYYPGENMMRIRKESMEKGVLVDEGIWKSVLEM